jgi:uncharacterized protein
LRPSFKKENMTLNVLQKTIESLLKYEKRKIDFIWHGGEPLILGLEFFKKIIVFQKRYNINKIEVINSVQTNATLLSKKFKDFFYKNNFSVGTSIQGPKTIHNLTRINLAGNGSFERVVESIKSMKDKPSAIAVLTRDIFGKEKETYYTLKKYAKGARISEYFPGGKNPGKVKDKMMPTDLEYGKSMIKFYKIWKKDDNPIDLRPITEIISSFIRGKSGGCIYSQEICNFNIIGIKENGDFYTCLRAAGRKEFFLGNILNSNPLSKFNKTAKRDYKKRIAALKKAGCTKCKFFNQCGGGCPQESFQLYGDYNHKTYYCDGRKMLFKMINEDIMRLKK